VRPDQLYQVRVFGEVDIDLVTVECQEVEGDIEVNLCDLCVPLVGEKCRV